MLPGVYLEPDILASTAFAALNETEIRVLIRFYQKRQFATKPPGQRKRSKEILNNGDITFPYSEAKEMGISASAFTRALDGLLARGFIDIAYSGEGMYRSVSRYAIATRWRLFGSEAFCHQVRRKRPRKVGFLDTYGKT